MFQQTELIGYVGQDPEMRFTPAGKAVTNLNVSVTRSQKKGEEWVNITTWFKLAYWEAQAEYVNKNFHKGDMVRATGTLADEINIFQVNGENRAKYEMKGETIKKLKNGANGNGGHEASNGNGHAAHVSNVGGSDDPFATRSEPSFVPELPEGEIPF